MLLLKRSEIEGLVPMREAISAVERAFKKYAENKVVYPAKTQITIPGREMKWWGFMPCFIDGIGIGVKVVSDYPNNKKRNLPTINAITILCDEEDGRVKAVMDGAYLTALRTGALGGIAVDRLARKDARTIGIFGCGVQARMQLEGAATVRNLKRALVYDTNSGCLEVFRKEMSKKLSIPIEGARPEEVGSCDIIITATSSSKPVLFGRWVKEGAHITSIGAHTPDARELDDELVRKAKVVVDCPDAFKSGDMAWVRQDVTPEIKDVVAGRKVRASENDITLFKSSGTALQDVAISSLAYEKARKAGLGTEIRLC